MSLSMHAAASGGVPTLPGLQRFCRDGRLSLEIIKQFDKGSEFFIVKEGTVCVTGVSGYLGSVLAQRLIERGCVLEPGGCASSVAIPIATC